MRAGPYPLRDALRIFGRDVSHYSIQGAVLRIGQFALFPVYLAFLGPQDFGVLALATVYAAFASPFLGMGLDTAVLRFFHEWPENERRARLGTIWLLAGGSAFLITPVFDALGRVLGQAVIRQVPYQPFLQLALWTAFFASFEAMPVALLRCRQQSARLATLAIGGFVLVELLKLYSLVVLKQGVLGVIRAGFLGSAILAVAYVYWMFRQVDIRFVPTYLRDPLGFALPRIPGGVIDMVTGILDRIILEKFVSVSDLGRYEVARRFGNIVRDVNAPLKAAWVPYAIRLAIQIPDAPRILARMASYYIAVLLLFGLVATLVSKELIALFGGAPFAVASAYVPVFVLFALLDTAFNLLGTNLYIARKTSHALVAATISLAIFAGSSLMLIPRWLIPGTLTAMFLYRVSFGTSLFVLADKYYHVPFEWRKIGSLVVLVVALLLVGSVLATQIMWVDLAIKGLIVGVFIAIGGFVILDGRVLINILKSRPPRMPASTSESGIH